MDDQFSNSGLARQLQPWFPIFSGVAAAAFRDHLSAIPTLGMPRKTERANDIHRAMRENFQRVCDVADPLLHLEMEPDGQGLDYLVVRNDPLPPIAVRWGRWDGVLIKRNGTNRTRQVQSDGLLFPDADLEEAGEMQLVSLGYQLEDDHVAAGRPQWWLRRLVLLRERPFGSEFIQELREYPEPVREPDYDEQLAPPLIAAREQESEDWERIVETIRSASA